MDTALRATSVTLAEFLRQRFMANQNLSVLFDSAHGGTMVVALNSPTEMHDNNIQGVSVWLYRVARDPERWNMPPERRHAHRLQQVPLPLRLHYLISPIMRSDVQASAETEQLILGNILQAFHDHPVLRGAALQDDFSGTDIELDVHLEPFSLEETARVRDMLKLEEAYELAVSYEVSTVFIESAREPEDIRPVTVVLPSYGVAVPSEEH